MTRTRAVIILCFVVAFAAGISGGLAVSRRPRQQHRHAFLVEQLDLTPEQADRIRDIWSQSREELRATMAGPREALEQEREDAIRAFLTDDQLALYEQVMEHYRRQREALGDRRREIIAQAVERTKEALTHEQRAKYETLLEERRNQGGPPWGRGRHRGPRESKPGAPSAAPRGEE